MVHSGQRYLTPSLAYALLRRHDERPKSDPTQGDQVPGLTPREREVLTIMVEGRSNKEIGRRLDMAEDGQAPRDEHPPETEGAQSRGGRTDGARNPLRIGDSPQLIPLIQKRGLPDVVGVTS